jgi:hypothetical protein
LILLLALAPCPNAGRAGSSAFEYPSAILDLHDADGNCWTGMDAAGAFPVRVVPEAWLVGPPPSLESAVTLPTDHWIDLAFSGRLVAGDGDDILLVETGKAGEQVLLFVTDGVDREYLLTKVVVENSGKQELSYFGVGLDGVTLPFVPRALRLVGLDRGGQSPGFDLSHVRARVSRECGPQAGCPNPVNGAIGVSPYTKLTWTPGYAADRQGIYLGEVAANLPAVATPPRDANTFEPATLGLGRTYYWRVDGVVSAQADVVSAGEVWSFTVADHLVVDDFEAYDLRRDFLYETWQSRGWAGISLDQRIVQSCRQSMSVSYHYDSVWSSEVLRVFATPQDWAHTQAEVLQILVRGTAGNATRGARLYVTLGDGHAEQTVPYAGDLSLLTEPRWNAWRIRLADFDGIDLTHVTTLAIGLRPATTNPQDRGAGTIYIDDITLHPSLCLANDAGTNLAEGRLPGDLTADCRVDSQDLARLAQDWLYDRTRVFTVTAPNEPVLWYEFDGDARDRAGRAHGQIEGRCSFRPGVYGYAIDFAGEGDRVTIPEAASVFGRAREAITIAFWQRGDDSGHRNDTLCCSNYIYGEVNPTLAIHLGCWRDPGQYRWDCGAPWSFENRLAGRHRDQGEWMGRWNHWAFTKDIRRGRMAIYLNGELYDSRTGAFTPITGITSFEIGSGWYGRYDGLLDDFQIYDYALSPAEIAYVATRGTGIFPHRANASADLNADGIVNFQDLASLATQWLQSGLWP